MANDRSTVLEALFGTWSHHVRQSTTALFAAVALVGLSAAAVTPTPTSAVPSTFPNHPVVLPPTQGFFAQSPIRAIQAAEARIRRKGNPAKNPLSASETKQIKAVAASISATLRLTPDQFAAWVDETTPDGRNNAMTWTGFADWDIPVPQPYKQPPYPITDVLLAKNGPNGLRYPSSSSAQLSEGPTSEADLERLAALFPIDANLGLTTFDYELQMWGSLALYNGSVTVNLTGEKNGKATISFATSIWHVWPDRREVKIPYAWVSNLDLPRSSKLGPKQSFFTDRPKIYALPHKSLDFTGAQVTTESRKELLGWLNDPKNVGMPLQFFPLGNALLQKTGGALTLDLTNGMDASVPGIDTNRFYPIYDALQMADFAKDPSAFTAALQKGIQAGIFPDPNKPQQSIVNTLSKMNNLDTTFNALPLGAIVRQTGATRPSELVPNAPRGQKPCPTTASASAAVGVPLTTLANESCGFIRPADDISAAPATCPRNWICTFDTGNVVVVQPGAGQRGTVYAATWRYIPAYSPKDPVHDLCALYKKEVANLHASGNPERVEARPSSRRLQSCPR